MTASSSWCARRFPTPRSNVRRAARWSTRSMGRLYDFFADNPTIPRLMVRRLLETTAGTSDIEREILLPAWRRFATWTYDLSKVVSAEDAPILMLTVHSVLLLFMLDSQQFSGLLGGSVRSPEMRARLRAAHHRAGARAHPRREEEAIVKALITASFTPEGLQRLQRHMQVEHEDWRAKHSIYFDGAEFARAHSRGRRRRADRRGRPGPRRGADRRAAALIGCCRGDPINIGVERATELGIPVLFAPGAQRRRGGRPHHGLHARAGAPHLHRQRAAQVGRDDLHGDPRLPRRLQHLWRLRARRGDRRRRRLRRHRAAGRAPPARLRQPGAGVRSRSCRPRPCATPRRSRRRSTT